MSHPVEPIIEEIDQDHSNPPGSRRVPGQGIEIEVLVDPGIDDNLKCSNNCSTKHEEGTGRERTDTVIDSWQWFVLKPSHNSLQGNQHKEIGHHLHRHRGACMYNRAALHCILI